MPDTDIVVVGMGPGGEHVAGRLAEAGLHVTGVETELVGGECPYWGCVPTKMMIRSANLIAEARRIPGMAGDSTVTPNWSPVARRIRDEATTDWDDQIAVDRFTDKGGHFVRGSGVLTGPNTVRVDATEFRARRGVVVATGARPQIPPIPGLDDAPYWTNREAVATESVPIDLLVLGGGSIGLELAQVFSRFGSEVTVVEALNRLLPVEEPETSDLLERVLGSEGITIHTDSRAVEMTHDGDTFTLALDTGEKLTAGHLLVSTGRSADLSGLGVDSVGLDPGGSALDVDGRMRATEGLWAIGDVTGKGAFTHVSMYQAEIAVRDILGETGPEADYRALPRVTFTDPEVGTVGMTETEAKGRGLSVLTAVAELPSSARGWIHKTGNEGFIKLIVDAVRGVLVGATSVGPTGGEVLYGLAVAIQSEMPVEDMRHMIYAYPTFHRAVEDALRGL